MNENIFILVAKEYFPYFNLKIIIFICIKASSLELGKENYKLYYTEKKSSCKKYNILLDTFFSKVM